MYIILLVKMIIVIMIISKTVCFVNLEFEKASPTSYLEPFKISKENKRIIKSNISKVVNLDDSSIPGLK